MKFNSIDLIAYGHFTERSLDLNDRDKIFYIISGNNEAGKTTILNAITDLLYGIDSQSTYKFIHPYASMRIGAELTHGNNIYRVIRRKGRQNTLRAVDDKEILDESFLSNILYGVARKEFLNIFGLNIDRLRKGGESLSRGHGELGTILFSAASGISSLSRIIQDLDEKAAVLYKRSGSKPEINRLLNRIKLVSDEAKESSLSVQQWKDLNAKNSRAEKEKNELQKKKTQLQLELKQIIRYQKSRTHFTRRKELLEKLEPYSTVILLADNFSEQYQLRFTERERLLKELVEVEAFVNKMRVQLKDKTIESVFTSRKKEILALYSGTEKFASALDQQLLLQQKLATNRSEGTLLLKKMGINQEYDSYDLTWMPEGLKGRADTLIREFDELRHTITKSKDALQEKQFSLEQLQEDVSHISPPKDTVILSEKLKEVLEDGRLENSLETKRTEVRQLTEELEAECRRLNYFSGSLEDLLLLKLPSPATLSEYQIKIDERKASVSTIRKELSGLINDIQKNEKKMEQLLARESFVTEQQLQDTRNLRELSWFSLISLWDEQQTNSEIAPSHIENSRQEFYSLMLKSDTEADSLRVHADEVAGYNLHFSLVQKGKEETKDMQNSLEIEEKELQRIEQEWCTLWQDVSITPGSPNEMRSFLEASGKIINSSAILKRLKIEVENLESKIQICKASLLSCMKNIGAEDCIEEQGLFYLCQLATRLINDEKKKEQDLTNKRKDIEAVTGEVTRLGKAISLAETAQLNWRENWRKVVSHLCLAADASPEEVKERLRNLEELITLQINRREWALELESLINSITQYEKRVKSLATGTECSGDNIFETVQKIHHGLETENNHNSYLSTARTRLSEKEEMLSLIRRDEARLSQELQQMAESCDADSIADIPEKIRLSKARSELEASLQVCVDLLGEHAEGKPVQEFIVELTEQNFEQLSERQIECTRMLQELEQELELKVEELSETTINLRQSFEATGAIASATDREMLYSEFETLLHRYFVHRLGVTTLRSAVEKYRQQNQSTVLTRASEIFRELTLSSFSGILTDFDDDCGQVLYGQRNGNSGGRVPLDGMSDGSLDQLYLALRLACLEKYYASREPVPFIADDILLNFDDKRAIAALKVLKAFSRHTQVLFFTHHSHLVELSKTHLGAEDVAYLEL